MNGLIHSAKLLLLDLASSFFFLFVYLLTKNATLAVALAIALGIAQIGWELARKKPIETMQWLSLALVVLLGSATLLTADPRFVLIKPSLIYVIVGLVMLKPGWMNRYLPPIAHELVPDIAFIFGFVWAGLMFFSAALNAFLALSFDVVTWAWFVPLFGALSKIAFLLLQYAVMRGIGVRRSRARLVAATTA